MRSSTNEATRRRVVEVNVFYGFIDVRELKKELVDYLPSLLVFIRINN